MGTEKATFNFINIATIGSIVGRNHDGQKGGAFLSCAFTHVTYDSYSALYPGAPLKSIASGPNLMAQLTMSDDSQAATRNPIWDVLRRSCTL